MWGCTIPSPLKNPTPLPLLCSYTFSEWMCFCVHICVRFLSDLFGLSVFERHSCMHVCVDFTIWKGAYRYSLKKMCTHKHTITVTCTHTQAISEVSCDHATYLHSSFKETVYKAVVDGALARCSWFFFFGGRRATDTREKVRGEKGLNK